MAWNCNGWGDTTMEDLHETQPGADIMGFIETKELKPAQEGQEGWVVYDCPAYTKHIRRRLNSHTHKPVGAVGGIKVMIKQSLEQHTSLLKVGRHQEFVSIEVKGKNTALTVIFAYIPHKQSRVYGNRDVQDLYVKLIKHIMQRQTYGPVILLGDINARTCGRQQTGYQQEIWLRKTQDAVMNNHGEQLILLQIAGMVILNETQRFPDSCKYTYHKVNKQSIIDYCCRCPDDAHIIKCFQV